MHAAMFHWQIVYLRGFRTCLDVNNILDCDCIEERTPGAVLIDCC